MARNYDDCMALARASLAKGFHTKQAQKDAAFFVAAAFDRVREEFSNIGHAERGAVHWYDMPQAWRDLHNAMPYTPAHWSAKRAKLFAAYPEIVKRGDECAALRVAIMAAPVVKAPPTRTAKQQADDARRRTCQICARPIYAEVGVIAHHGYERPGMGWQTASCPGARELPFEVSRDALVAHIARQRAWLAGLIKGRNQVVRDFGPVARDFTREVQPRQRFGRQEYTEHCVTFTLETLAAAVYFAAPAFTKWGCTISENNLSIYPEFREPGALYTACLTEELKRRAVEIKNTQEYIDYQQKRADAWVALERWNDASKKWEAINAA
jgi:hypothetical protein